MSAERLRLAADRIYAMADQATPGPWSSGLTGVYQPEGSYVARWEDGSQTPVTADRMYIAAMNPDVGKALAAWLRDESERMKEYVNDEGDWSACDICAKSVGDDCDCWNEPLAVADAILGGTS